MISLARITLAFLTDEERGALQITHAIFHVVGKGEGDFRKLDVGFEPGPFAAFFLDRIFATAQGTLCDFLTDSPVLESLRRIEADAEAFVPESQRLATSFSALHEGNAKKGAFLVFTLASPSGPLHAMLKLDHESVVAYRILDNEGITSAEMSEILETFVKSPDALQKGAVARIRDNRAELVVHDHKNKRGISAYFERFLGSRRRFTDAELTKKVVDIARDVANKHADVLSPEVRQNVVSRIFGAARSGEAFVPDEATFTAAAFGMLEDDSPITSAFARALKAHGIEDERFTLDPELLPASTRRKVVTVEGFEIEYPGQFRNRMIIAEDPVTKQKTITITTAGIVSDDVDPG